jgi:hypothetical protein
MVVSRLARNLECSSSGFVCHTMANLEIHHFKYPAHQRPGDVHLHFFDTATHKLADGVCALPGDVFEVGVAGSGRATNPLARADAEFNYGGVRSL